jgi:opacity protein-like surface antigen
MKSSGLILSVLFIFFIQVETFGQSLYKDQYERKNSIAIGAGPSFMYADNGGVYNNGDFKWKPALSLAYLRKMGKRFAIQATTGLQLIESGGTERDYAIEDWEDSGGAFRFKGQAYFLDLMPVLYLIPYDTHLNRGRFNAYLGSGVGFVQVRRKEAFSFDDNAAEFKKSSNSFYIPALVGLSYSITPLSDLSLEIKGLFSFSDYLDGNVGYNQFNDHFVQTQIVYRRLLRN